VSDDHEDFDPRQFEEKLYYSFPDDLKKLFRDSGSARLARALENSPRNTQKWANGTELPPDHAVEFVAEQTYILNGVKEKGDPYLPFRQHAQTLIDAGLHIEVVASMVSQLYEELTGKTVR
jgi:hypothetical protein